MQPPDPEVKRLLYAHAYGMTGRMMSRNMNIQDLPRKLEELRVFLEAVGIDFDSVYRDVMAQVVTQYQESKKEPNLREILEAKLGKETVAKLLSAMGDDAHVPDAS